jgi:hypothetical protein
LKGTEHSLLILFFRTFQRRSVDFSKTQSLKSVLDACAGRFGIIFL